DAQVFAGENPSARLHHVPAGNSERGERHLLLYSRIVVIDIEGSGAITTCTAWRRIASSGVDGEEVGAGAGEGEGIGDLELAVGEKNRGGAGGGEGGGELDFLVAAGDVGGEDRFAEGGLSVREVD